MLQLHCPYCRELRAEEEFAYAGEAHIRRPAAPSELSDREWGEYLHFRRNPRGAHREMWFHAAGCRRYFNALRDTVSSEVLKTYRLDDPPDAAS